jgi:hypothetical protein
MAAPWLVRMRWLDLLFAHWPFDPGVLRPLVPADPDFAIETYDGRGWLGVVPFVMADVAPRGIPAIPRLSRFPELNVRTYVTYRGEPGVWFLSLEAASRGTVVGGRAIFHVPYHHAAMAAAHDGDAVAYRSLRIAGGRPFAEFRASYQPIGPVARAAPGSFDAWSTDRPRLFAIDRRGRVWRTEVRHEPWPLQPAEATIDAHGLLATHGLVQPKGPPVVRYAARIDVRGWLPVRA